MVCQKCRATIPAARLKALPHTITCVACSEVEPLKGVMLFDHKTAPYIHVVTPKQHAVLKRHDRRSVHSNMPMSTRTVTGIESSVSRPLTQEHVVPQDTRPRARKCPHKDAPQASWYGMCLPCALDWYSSRIP